MRTTQIILGEVMTERALRLKEGNMYMLRVHPAATKIDVKNALRLHFGVEPLSVRIMHLGPKYRMVGRGKVVTKRDASKRAIVRLAAKSKPLDLTVLTA